MIKKARPVKSIPSPAVSPRRWPIYLLMAVCAALLVSGFFLAGQQHFSSMDYGMKNSRLQKQIEELEAQKRRLLLAREFSLSPAEIMRVAKKTGLTDSSVPPVEMTARPAAAKDASPQKTAATSAAAKPLVVKTADVAPLDERRSVPAISNSGKVERPTKKQSSSE